MAKLLFSVPAYTADWLIVDSVANPKRPGTKCWYRYDLLEACDTVAEAKAKLGKGYRLEIAWCAARGYINLVDPADAARSDAEVAAEAEAETEAEAEVAAEPESAAEAEVAAEAEAEIPAFLSKKARRAAKAAAEANA